MEGITWAPHSDLIWIAADTYDLTRQEFEYMMEALVSLEWTSANLVSLPKPRYHPCAMETHWGCRIETRTLHDVVAFAARAPDLIILCEPGQAPSDTLRAARERLSTRRGRLWMSGTFEDIPEAWLEDVWRRWVRWPNEESGKSYSVPTWLNRYSFPGGRHDPEIALLRASCRSMNEFLLRCAGVPAPQIGLVIGDAWQPRRNILPNMEFEAADRNGRVIPVELAIDPGYSGGSHYVVEAIQRHGKDRYIIDEVVQQSLVHEGIIQKCIAWPWWKNVTGGTIDPYAGDSHIFGSLSPMEVWWKQAKIRLRMPPRWSVEDTVSRLCCELCDPIDGSAHLFASPRAERFIWEMTHWRKRKTRGGFGPPTQHSCDAAKAVAYYLSWQYNIVQTGVAETPVIRPYTFV